MLPGRIVPRSAYLAPPDVVSRWLLGKLLVRRISEAVLAGRIVEVEAYFGEGDPAAHASSGRTHRNSVIFGPPGHAYVYFIYGRYDCLNISCEPEGQAGCVLIRALEPVEGFDRMRRNRGLPAAAKPAEVTAGPGRLCQAMGITRGRHNGLDLTDPDAELQVREDGFVAHAVTITPRIGITKAADRPLRFCLEGSVCLSRAGKMRKS